MPQTSVSSSRASSRRTSSPSPSMKDLKYSLYLQAVQSPELDVKFFRKVYMGLNRKKEPTTLREDFCGSFALSCEWVKLQKHHKAIAVDLDKEPLDWGHKHHFQALNAEKQKRLKVCQGDVRTFHSREKADIIVAPNFSSSFFHHRSAMKDYQKNAYRELPKGGILMIDTFGGSECMVPNEEETQYTDLGFSYFWDQETFDPITNLGRFHIHFRLKTGRLLKKAFSYSFRLWSLPELRELMTEVGFKETYIYWEGTTRKGEGNGVFTQKEKGEACETWIAYVVGRKT